MSVKPIIQCGNCGSPLSLNDKFCAKCGSAVLWDAESTSPDSESPNPATVVCPSCGILNLSTNSLCSGCGSSLVASPIAKKKSGGVAQHHARGASLSKRMDSWKMVAIGAIVVIVVVFGIGVFRNSPKQLSSQSPSLPSDPGPSVSPTLLSDIESLEKNSEANPRDAGVLLRLANALHDAKFMPRAIESYKKYLKLHPQDADARVDMGICLFESGDSPTAIEEMKTALKHSPKHQMAMFNIGIVMLNQGNLNESNDWFKKAVSVDPNTPIAQRAQQLLNQHSTIQP